MIARPISDKRQKLIDEKNNSTLEIGEKISVLQSKVTDYAKDKDRVVSCTVLKLNPLIVTETEYMHQTYRREYEIQLSDIKGRNIRNIGVNPFDTNGESIRLINYDVESIISTLNILNNKDSIFGTYNIKGTPIMEINWNPYVYDKESKKQYYQRDFVWTLEDNQLLIESIYNGIDCGKILVRLRSWEELKMLQAKGETELAFKDIIDGKQRLNAIRGFILCEYPDMNGNYFSDLSGYSQSLFTGNQLLSYAELSENSKDEDILRQFLKMNFCGVPQSTEHINYVKELRDKIKQ